MNQFAAHCPPARRRRSLTQRVLRWVIQCWISIWLAVSVRGGDASAIQTMPTLSLNPLQAAAALPPLELPGARTIQPQSTNASNAPGTETARDLALHGAPALQASSNMIALVHEPKSVPLAPEASEVLLEIARKQRREGALGLADENFRKLLGSSAEESVKRSAMLELALMSQEQGRPTMAQQYFADYVYFYPDDPGVPEVLLRQGLLYRDAGAPMMAISKFYAVMTGALKLKTEQFDHYQRLVLRAQTEIADTYYLQGRHEEAVDFFRRVLKLSSVELNRAQVLYKLIRSLAALDRPTHVILQGTVFLESHTASPDTAEVRYLLAGAYTKLGRHREALEQVLAVLRSQDATAGGDPQRRAYWQQRIGNDIGNKLYREGDYLNALTIYENLASLDTAPAWQMPAWYQMGLVFERLEQPKKALDCYERILARGPELKGDSTPNLKTLLDMASLRKEHLTWSASAEQSRRQLSALGRPAATAARPSQ
jgi:tetratricopeptide (TPR) repeat protein